VVLGFLPAKGRVGEDVSSTIPVPIDGHENVVSRLVLYLEDQLAEGGTVERSLGNGEVQSKEVLRGDLAEAAGYVALSLVGRGKSIMLLLRGIEPKDINQAMRQVGVEEKGRKAEDSTNHSLSCSLMIMLTINVDNVEARGASVAGGRRWCERGGRFHLIGSTP